MWRFVNFYWPGIGLRGRSVDSQGDSIHPHHFRDLLAMASTDHFRRLVFKEERLYLQVMFMFISFCDQSTTVAIELDKLLAIHLKMGKPIPTVAQLKGLAFMLLYAEADSSDDGDYD